MHNQLSLSLMGRRRQKRNTAPIMSRRMTIAALLLALALGGGPAVAQQGIPPSAAVRAAVAAVPGAEPLGVSRHGDVYVVRLKVGGQVVQVTVDAATGAVSQQ